MPELTPQEREKKRQWDQSQQQRQAEFVMPKSADKNAMPTDNTGQEPDQPDKGTVQPGEEAGNKPQFFKRQLQKLRNKERDKQTEISSEQTQKKSTNSVFFGIALSLSIIKDIIDALSLGILGTIINIIVIGLIIIVAIYSGQSVKEILNKRKLVIGSSAVIEFIPFVSILPVWTISIIWMWLEDRKGKPVDVEHATKVGKKVFSKFSKK